MPDYVQPPAATEPGSVRRRNWWVARAGWFELFFQSVVVMCLTILIWGSTDFGTSEEQVLGVQLVVRLGNHPGWVAAAGMLAMGGQLVFGSLKKKRTHS